MNNTRYHIDDDLYQTDIDAHHQARARYALTGEPQEQSEASHAAYAEMVDGWREGFIEQKRAAEARLLG